MDRVQKHIVNMLDAAIHGKKIEFKSYSNIPWREIIHEGREHNILPLLYSSISNTNVINKIDKVLLNDIKREVFNSSIKQINHINQTSIVLDELNRNNIKAIVLKGLVIRDLYPIPQLRTMSDADLIVNINQLEKVTKVLINMGYFKIKNENEHGAHIVFYKANSCIEVHWTLLNQDFFKGDKDFNELIWENAMEITLASVKTLSLCWEDIAVHLCVHMASHFSSKGFGIRQILDLVLLVEKKGQEINWLSFQQKIKNCKLNKFTVAIFNVCKILFGMEIPTELKEEYYVKRSIINSLIEDIFAAGVFGNKNKSKVFGRALAFQKANEKGTSKLAIIARFLKVLFPPIEKMNSKYDYAKKNKLLIPIAWVHHLMEGFKNKEYGVSEKIKILLTSIFISNKRSKLLKELEM